MGKPYLTPEDLRELLPYSLPVIYRELKAGTIPSIRLGRRYMIPTAAFDAWLASCGPPRSAA